MSAANERALDATLKTSLVNEDPFLYAHLIKFERAIGTDGSRPSKNGRDYVYLTDASRDIAFDDGSTNVAGVANGVQTYRANRVASVGTISETTEAKASSLSFQNVWQENQGSCYALLFYILCALIVRAAAYVGLCFY